MADKRLGILEPGDDPPDLRKLLEQTRRELRKLEDRLHATGHTLSLEERLDELSRRVDAIEKRLPPEAA